MGYMDCMAGTVSRIGAIQGFIGAEDPPPPHVHAFHTGQGWRARYRFSFLSDVTGLYRFRKYGKRPSVTTLNQVSDAIMQNLADCRAAWWANHGSGNGLGLVNQRIETMAIAGGDKILAKVALAPAPAAVGIVSAAYSQSSGRVTLQLADGRRLSLTAGQHIEEAKEW